MNWQAFDFLILYSLKNITISESAVLNCAFTYYFPLFIFLSKYILLAIYQV